MRTYVRYAAGMSPAKSSLRWSLAGTEQQGSLLDDDVDPTRELREVEYLHVRARSIISEVPRASRMPFRYTINPYRGCSHACTYCFARPTHEYLGLNGLEDFERRIVVKINAVQRLAAELARPSWGGEHIAMGTNTDPYQQAEGRYKLTRGIIETLAQARNPFSVLTKSTMIMRDIELFQAAAERTEVKANLSIGTLDEDVWHTSEPGTPPPLRRVEAVARLNQAGVPCGVLIAPILPGISDGEEQLSAVVRACVEAGAVSISSITLHLRPGVRELFMPWLERARPDLVDRYKELYGSRSGYLAREEQERVSARVRALVQEYGGCAKSPRQSRLAPVVQPRRNPPAAPDEQLPLVG
jgi:DNA repair photolyase